MKAWGLQKRVDKAGVAPYPTGGMSSPLSPDMLKRGAIASRSGPKGGIRHMAAKKKAKKASKKKK
jgi:hypothetical protein